MPDPKPNVIHISWHDAGRHFGCYGQETVHTPNIDRLAAEGTLFERAFACGAVCSPSRAAAMTGRYPQSNGVMGLCHGNFRWQYKPGEKHLAALMRERGYFSTLQGFQHETPHDLVDRLGFDLIQNAGPKPPVHPVPPCDAIAADAAAFLESPQAKEPFYLQLGFFETHRPYNFGGCEPDASKGVAIPPYLIDNAFAREDHAALQGAIRKADAAVGVVLDALRDQGLEENTIVVFSPDHGLANPRAKATLYDPGLEIAHIWRWPGGSVPPGNRSSRLVSNVDLVPTLFDLLGEPPLERFEGRSFADELGGRAGSLPREFVFAEHLDGEQRACRSAVGKLVLNFAAIRKEAFPYELKPTWHPILQMGGGVQNVGPLEYYDLENDPRETTNLANDPAAAPEAGRHLEALWQWLDDVEDPVLKGPTPPPRWSEAMATRPKGR